MQLPYLKQIEAIAQKMGLAQDTQTGFWHVDPYPTKAQLQQVYEREYMSSRYPLAPEFSTVDLDTAQRRYSPILEALHSFSPTARSFLDIGSFGCEMLYLAREAGFDVTGIDAAGESQARAQRYELPFVQGFFEPDQTLVENSYDIVNMGFVLEHVPEPRSFLAEVKAHLNSNGLICLSVPNDFNPYQLDALKLGVVDRPWWVVPDEHLNYFSAYSLTNLLAQEGFKILSVYNSFPVERYLLDGQNYVMDPSLGKEVYRQRQEWYAHFEQTGQAAELAKTQRTWAEEGIGREVFVVAQKA